MADSHWRFVSNPLVTPDLIVVPSCKNGPTVAVKPAEAKGDIGPDNKAEAWRIKTTPDVVVPLRVGDVIYFGGHGSVTGQDVKTGKKLSPGTVTKGYHWSNLVAAGGKVYTTSQEGVTDVIEAGREFKKVGTGSVPDKVFGSPALSGGRIYLRATRHPLAIGPK